MIFKVTGGRTANDLVARLKARGVLVSSLGRNAIRLVTHLDVNRAACIHAAEALTQEIESLAPVA